MSTAICTICHEDLINPSARECTALDCGHVFHEDCLDAWNTFSAYCPVCKRYVGQDCKRRELYFSVKHQAKEGEEIPITTTNASKPLTHVSKKVKEYHDKIEKESDPHERLELLYCSYEELQSYFTAVKRKFTEDEDI